GLETATRSWETLAQTGETVFSPPTLDRLGIAIDCADNDRCLELELDENKFRQIVGNLIKNALQYRRQRIDIRLGRQDEWFCLAVTDDGPGVAAAHSELIFNCYTRINANALPSRSGHGLGLAGARILARRMGGDITVTAGPGSGARFKLMLPLNSVAMACE
ncbi:sensor histidine kinase, partial [Desulfosarcina cetonica]|uniref:sensor histidine kinase n=1 Tax=Desulfosarcina cetonica TaxID=90730 RepID=UPI00155DC227